VTDWSARADAALALRRLNRAFAGFEVGSDVLAELTRRAGEMADTLEAGERRDKEADNWALHGEDGAPPVAAVGEAMEFDPFSAAGGRFHPSSIGLDIRRDGETSIFATAIIDPMFQGPPGRVHGGVIALIADEVMGCVNRASGQRAFTARLTVNLRAPAPTGETLEFRAWQRERRGRKILIDVEGRSPAGVFVDGEALFVAPAEVAPET
jgi:acyl-coenzyme A thioesterase PaaI-like protein